MHLPTTLKGTSKYHRYVTADDMRKVFGDYRNLLRWLSRFLIHDEKLATTCIVDACSIAQTQAQDFHEWLVHWAARATVARALQGQRAYLAELSPKYEQKEAAHVKRRAISPEQFLTLTNNPEEIGASLDVLCRFVLVLRGIAKDSCAEVAAQLAISRGAVERAYDVACGALELLASDALKCHADVANRFQGEANVSSSSNRHG